ncbi:MAG: hypothetical protein O2887_08855 [Bacteroidetes bacterium]|nr:hypothetical protein [Bacteroidota bacterium]MDA1120583.1 hypothetical protein [Bacteroidota bacterium]
MKAISFLVFQLMVTVCQAQFVHPGMLHNKKDLELVRQKVHNGEEPWKSASEDLKASDNTNLSWIAKPINVVVVGTITVRILGQPISGVMEMPPIPWRCGGISPRIKLMQKRLSKY